MNRIDRSLVFAVTLSLTSIVVPAIARAQVMQNNDHLFCNQTLIAPSCFYHLDMQTDGNLVLYAGPGRHVPIWATGTVNNAAGRLCQNFAVMQFDGNLVVYNPLHQPVWASNTNGDWWSHLFMQDDGNLVIYNSGWDRALWASGTNGARLGSTCSSQSSVTTFEQDVNRNGGDFKVNANIQNPHGCAAACWGDLNCKAYTWVPPGIQGPTANCWLKNSVPAPTYAPGLVSGMITGR